MSAWKHFVAFAEWGYLVADALCILWTEHLLIDDDETDDKNWIPLITTK